MGKKPLKFKYIGISINQKNYKLESDTTVPVYQYVYWLKIASGNWSQLVPETYTGINFTLP